MTLTDCQLLSIVAQLGTFAAAAERLHITPSAVSPAVSGVEAACGKQKNRVQQTTKHPHQKRRNADRRRRKAHARHSADARQQRVA